MSYRIKITGLTNQKELMQQSAAAHRLYKFSLSEAPDGFWVLLLQQASAGGDGITVSGNAGSKELWVSAPSDVPVQGVLQRAKRAVGQANVDANASDAAMKPAPAPVPPAAAPVPPVDALAAEIAALRFDDDEEDAGHAPSPAAPSAPAASPAAPSEPVSSEPVSGEPSSEPKPGTQPGGSGSFDPSI